MSNPRQAGNGDSIDLDASKSVELQRNEELILSGFLAEKDQLGTGADDRAPLNRSYDASENWGDGQHQVEFNYRKMACTLHYTIQVE